MVEFRIDVVVDPSNAVAGTRTVERSLARVENRADALRSGLGRAFAFFGAGALLTSSVSALASFEQAMSEVGAVSGATADEFAALRDRALELGAATRFTATQSATALAELARAGFTAGEALASVGDTLLLAQAGGLGLAEATDIASNAIRSFRLTADQAGRVADVLAKAANASNTSVGELGEGLKFVAPIAATLGVSLEQTAAAMGVLSDSGLKASIAGTGLRQIFASLLNPTKEAQVVFSRLGLATEDYDVSTRGLIPVLQELADKGFTVADALTVFGDRGGPAFEVLKTGIPRLRELTQTLDESAGSARQTAAIMDDNLNGALLRVKSSFEALVLGLGGAGATGGLRALFEGLAQGLRSLAANSDTVIRFAQNLALFFGPRYLLGAIRAVGVAVAANPLGLLLTVIAAVVAAVPDLQGQLDGLIATLGELASTITAGLSFEDLFRGLASAIDGTIAVFNGLLAASGAVFDALSEQPAAAAELMKKAFRDAVEATIDFFFAMAQTIGQIILGLGKDFVAVTQNIGGVIGAISAGNLEAAQSFSDNLESALLRSANRITTFTGQFKQNLSKLQGDELLPPVTLSKEAANLGAQVASEFQRGLEESAPTAQQTLDRLLGRPDELAAEAARRLEAAQGAAKAVPPPAESTANQSAGPSQRAQELLQQIDVVSALKEEEAALNEVLKLRPDLARSINDAMLAAQIAALDTSTALEDGFSRAFLKLQQEAQNLAVVAEGVVNAFADRATDAIAEFARTGEFSFKKFASAVLEDITRILIRLLVVQAISAALGGGAAIGANLGFTAAGGGGAREEGGTVQPDRSYLVGENGPELFQPNQSGTIVPNAASVSAPPPQVNLQVVNVDDPAKIPAAINSGDNDEAFINLLARNKDRVSQVIR